MPTSFQPVKPHDPARRTRGRGTIILTAAIASLMIVMLVALGLPRMTGAEGANWLILLVLGVVMFALIMAIGIYLNSKKPVTRGPVDER